MNTNDIKINVLIAVAGSTPYTDEEIKNLCTEIVPEQIGSEMGQCEFYHPEKASEYKDVQKMVLGKSQKGEGLDVINIVTNKRKPATQSINMTQEAYLAFTDNNDIPYGVTKHDWQHLSKKQKVEWHLKQIAESLNGEVINYEIFGD